MATGTAKRAGTSVRTAGASLSARKAKMARINARGKKQDNNDIEEKKETELTTTETKSPEKLTKQERKEKKLRDLLAFHYNCPVETALGRKVDEDGDELFYTGKEPFNGENFCNDMLIESHQIADLYKWQESDKDKYPKGSLDDNDDIHYFKCKDGSIAKNDSDGIRTCVSICPLNVALEKGSNKDQYISTENGYSCSIPANATARPVKDGENTRGDLDDKDAYIIECNANKYSAVLDGSFSSVHYQCLACPSGYVSAVGSKSSSDCKEECKDGKITGKDGSCITCDSNASVVDNACVCKDGYFGIGYGENGCEVCPEGYICSGGEKKSKYISDTKEENSSNEQQSCPEGSKPSSDGTSCVCNDSNYTFDAKSNSCVVSNCDAGKILENGKCVECPEGYYCSGNNTKTACPAGKYNNTLGAKSSSACKKCEDYHWSDEGSSECGKIKIHLWYSYWADDNDVNKNCTLNMNKWFEAGTQVKASNDNFGGDPKEKQKKGAGAPCWHIANEGDTINLNCTSLPCTIQGPNGRYLKVTADRNFQCAKDDGKFWECNGGKSGSDLVKWKD